jgi:ribose 1,5-bisphosphokinase PhnN
MSDAIRDASRNARPGLLTVSGPYGAGKDTVLDGILEYYPGRLLYRVRTLTTRPSTPDADPSYSTVSEGEFRRRTAVGQWIVNQQFGGAVSYATSADEIREQMASGRVCLHTVFAGPAGVGRMREVFGKQLFAIGLLASNNGIEEQISVLRKRLHGRTRDDAEALNARLRYQYDPIKYVLDNPRVSTIDGEMKVFDAVVVNQDRDQTVATVQKLFSEVFLIANEDQ